MKKCFSVIAVCLVMCLLLAGCAENPAGTGNYSQQTGNESTASAGSETKASESEAADNTAETEKPADADASEAPVVYFTSDISAEGLVRIYETLDWTPEGNVAVKISTGEPPASNYLRPELIGDLVKKVDGTIVECNTAYGGSRSSSAMHKQVAEDHGFTAIADFDLMDEEGEVEWPMSGGTKLDKIIVGSHAENYSDCDGHPAEPDIHDIGILASTDPVALDQACVDLIYQAEGNASLVKRMESLHAVHTLEHAEEIGLGSRTYELVNIDD